MSLAPPPSTPVESAPAPPAPAVRALVRLALPAIATSLLQTLVFLADRLLLGRHSEAALASMQVQGPLLWSLWGVFTGLLVGTVPLVARAVGAGDARRASAVTRVALRAALALGVAVAAPCFFLVEPIVGAIGPSDPALLALSATYVRIALVGIPSMFVATTAAMALSAAGDTRTPLVAGLAANAVNVALNVVLIFGFELGEVRLPPLGVAGAAIGSAVAFTLEAALLVRALVRTDLPVRVDLGAVVPDPGVHASAFAALVGVSVPALGERLVVHAGYLAYASVLNRLGALVMASNQALVTLESVCFLGAEGFGIAAAAIVGQSLGRRDPAGASRAGWVGAGLCAVVLTALGLAILAAGDAGLRLFVPPGADGTALVREGASALGLVALSQPFMAVSVVLAHSLRGAGDTRSPFLVAALGGLVVRVSLAAWLGLGLGLGVRAAWWSSLADWIVRTLLFAAIFARGRWRRAHA
ncbi:MAG: MATE family efflux transporter [Polyangiaceae bacterium]|nr:MATE family efflux transporter [Polyangiaceae bacterium]